MIASFYIQDADFARISQLTTHVNVLLLEKDKAVSRSYLMCTMLKIALEDPNLIAKVIEQAGSYVHPNRKVKSDHTPAPVGRPKQQKSTPPVKLSRRPRARDMRDIA